MTNPWAFALIVGALVCLFLTRNTPRCWMFLGAGAASFVASSLFWDFASSHMKVLHPVFTFLCDAMVCAFVSAAARQKWEIGFLLIYMTSAFISLLKIPGFVPEGLMYAAMLELCNWAALFLIGGVGLTDMLNKHDLPVFRRLHTHLHSPYRLG